MVPRLEPFGLTTFPLGELGAEGAGDAPEGLEGEAKQRQKTFNEGARKYAPPSPRKTLRRRKSRNSTFRK